MRLTHNQEYCSLLCVAGLMRVLPRPLALLGGAAIGQLGWSLRIRRQVVIDNLRQALPRTPDSQLRRIGAKSARNFGRTMVEFIRFSGRDRQKLDEIVALSGVSALREALGQKRGALILTGHLGAWALYFTALAAEKIPIALLVGKQHNPKVDKFIHSIPGDQVTLIPKGKSAIRKIMQNLQEGCCVVMVADQHAGRTGIMAPFLGKDTPTLALPGSFVAKHNPPVFLMKGHRVEKGRHKVTVSPIDIPECPCRDSLKSEVTRCYNEAIGKAVLDHPEQYFWYHRRWRDSDHELAS